MTEAILVRDSIQRATEQELEDRRRQVLTLRLRRLSQEAIARALHVDQATICRDLKWIRFHGRSWFGPPLPVEPSEEVGEAIDLFAEVEMRALRSFDRLKPEEVTQRSALLRTALTARQMRLDLLQDLGFMDRGIGNMALTLRADAVRQALRDEGLLYPDDVPTVSTVLVGAETL